MLIKVGGRKGWIRNRSGTYVINNPNTGKGKTKRDGVTFYSRWNGSDKIIPPIAHYLTPLSPGKEVRIQVFKDPWALIASIPGDPFFEGWIKMEFLEKV
jgi:hypothetical protein